MMQKQTKYYRNRVPVSGIDPDALWVMNDASKLVLVDADQHAEVELDARFYPVDEPVFLHPDDEI